MNECTDEMTHFEANLLDSQANSRRQAIYLKDGNHFNSMFVILRNSRNDRFNNILPMPSIVDHQLINSNNHCDRQQVVDCILRPKNRHFELILSESSELVSNDSDQCIEVNITCKPKKTNSNKSRITRKQNEIIFKLCASISLNRIVLQYDKKLKIFLNTITPNKYDQCELEELLRRLVFTQKRYQIADFEKSPRSISAKHIEDFEMKPKIIIMEQTEKCLEDFEKFNHNPAGSESPKTFSDYEWKMNKMESRPPMPPPRDVHQHQPPPPPLTFVRNGVHWENIYQPIWTFQTIGYAQEPDPADYDDGNYYNSSDLYEEIDFHEWEVAEEFSYATELLDEEILCDPIDLIDDPYQSVCILYNNDEPKYNQMIYDTQKCGISLKSNSIDGNNDDDADDDHSMDNFVMIDDNKRYAFPAVIDVDEGKLFESVHAWQTMIMRMDYMEDEEDVNLLIEDVLLTKPLENNYNHIDKNRFNSNGRITEQQQQQQQYQHRPNDLDIKKESGFLNKLQSGRVEISKGSFWSSGVASKSKENLETFSQLNFDSGEPSVILKKSPGHQTYGVTLDELEKDEQNPSIPRFLTECVRIIELTENIQSIGIFRASGKKESIDKVKKKMDEKSRKGTKYGILKQEDIHTVTGALKQFFRELKTELIPIQLFKNLPQDLELDHNFVAIKREMNKIDGNTRKTLKYLLEHLRRVDQNSEYNLMTASNLSIVWGACLFTASVSDTDTFETSELIKKNMLIRILIQRYPEIFPSD